MKRAVIIVLTALFLTQLYAPAILSAQERESEKITVKNKEVNNILVILAVQSSKSSFELQCNKNFAGCTALDPADYLMVRLGRNRGLYDCVNAEVYGKNANSEMGDRLGQYCLIDKK
jgi:hypothetical protein